jgi:hypothetical protein
MTTEKTPTYYTAEEWTERLRAGISKGIQILPIAQAVAEGPGEAVLALLFAALSICQQYSQLPDFKWYAEQVQDVSASAASAARARSRGAS